VTGLRRRRAEHGSAAVELPVAIGLLLVPVALLVISLPAWPERQTVARSAAAEASRTMALAGSWEQGAAQARAVVARAATNSGLDPADMSVALAGSLERGASVTATVRVAMPGLALPGLGPVAGWRWTASHTARVDDYRSLP